MPVDYAARATAHYRWAERYNEKGNSKKALAHFGRALEYDKRAKPTDPAFGDRRFGEWKLHPNYLQHSGENKDYFDRTGSAVKFPKDTLFLDTLKVEKLRGVGSNGTDFAIPAVGSGMFVDRDALTKYAITYYSYSFVVNRDELLAHNNNVYFEIGAAHFPLVTEIKIQFGSSLINGTTEKYAHYSWVPTGAPKATHFIVRGG